MPDLPIGVPFLGLGVALAVADVAGLAWTVRRGLRTRAGAGWYLGSFAARLAVVGVALASMTGGTPDRLVAAGLGFLLARPLAVRAWPIGGDHARHP